ncbi:MAG: TonB-dependent receptor [Bacteroidota bacterium]
MKERANKVVLLFLLFANVIIAQIDPAVSNESTQKITTALLDLATHYQYNLIFQENYFEDQNLVDFQLDEQATLEANLTLLLKNTNVSFILKNKTIELKRTQTIYGYVKDRESHEPLINATIYNPQLQVGTYTNEYGYFSLTLPFEVNQLKVQYIGYQQKTINLTNHDLSQKTILLEPRLDLATVTINSIESQSKTDKIIEERDILSSEITTYISSGGEPDINQHLYKQTGVSSGPDGLGGLHVRGGNTDQNLILLDGVRVFQPNHAFGLFSIFNTTLLKNARFSKYDFHPKNAESLSSVLEMTLKEGSTQRWTGNVSFSTLATQISADGPLKKDKTSLLVSLRRSHLDEAIKRISARQKQKESAEGETSVAFYDVYLKMQHILSAKDKLFLSYYRGQDQYSDLTIEQDSFDVDDRWSYELNSNISWENEVVALKWNHLFGDRLFATSLLSYTNFNYNSEFDDEYSYLYENELDIFSSMTTFDSNNNQISGKLDVEFYPNDRMKYTFGGQAQRTRFLPGILQERYDDLDVVETTEPSLQNGAFRQWLTALYFNYEQKIKTKTKLYFGVKHAYAQTSSLTRQSRSKFHLWNARLAVAHQVNGRLNIHLSANRNEQALHLLSSSDIGLPNDVWLPVYRRIEPPKAWQINALLQYQFSEKLYLSSSIFYKKMENLTRFPLGSSLPSLNSYVDFNWQRRLLLGNGIAKGGELDVQYKTTKLVAQLAYTLSDYQRIFPEIEEGNAFPFAFNQRHNLSFSSNYQFHKNIAFQLSFAFNDGLQQTLYRNDFYSPLDASSYYFTEQVSETNARKLPAYHRLDVAFSFKFDRKLKQNLVVGIQNIYNRKNIYYQYIRSFYDLQGDLIGNRLTDIRALPLLPIVRYSIIFEK